MKIPACWHEVYIALLAVMWLIIQKMLTDNLYKMLD